MPTDIDAARAKRPTSDTELALIRAAFQEQGKLLAAIHQLVIQMDARLDDVIAKLEAR